MQISKINVQNSIKQATKVVSNPINKIINKVSENPAKTTLVSTAAVSGMYVAAKSSKARADKMETLKSLGLNDQTAQKVINAKDEYGNTVFNKKKVEQLAETAELEDTAFFTYVMKNIDTIQSFEKSYDKKTKETAYSIMAYPSKEETLSATLKITPDEIQTDFVEDNGNKSTYRSRVYSFETGNINESIEKTILEKKHVKNKNQYTVVEDERTISNETISYNVGRNQIKREQIDITNNVDVASSSSLKFSPQGVIVNKVSTKFDNSKLQAVVDKKISLKELEKIVGEKVDKDVYDLAAIGMLPSKILDKLISSKSVNKDFEHNAVMNSKCSSSPTLMHEMVRTAKNPRTGRVETQRMQITDVPGVYNSTVTDDMGNTRVESSVRKNSDGSVYVEKNLESLDGTMTHYTYKESKDKNQYNMHYQVVTQEGEVLTTVDRTFNRVNPNLAYSSINGHSYKIEKQADAYVVTDNLNGKVTTMKLNSLVKGKDTKGHLDVLDKLSGDMLLDLYSRHYKYRFAANSDEACMDNTAMFINSNEDLFDFSHEQGHSKDLTSSYEKLGRPLTQKEIEKMIEEDVDLDWANQTKISSHPEFRKAYEQERADFMKAFPGIEQGYIDYFIDRIDHYNGYLGGAMEVVAEINGLLSTSCGSGSDDCLQTRSHYLQKYFPRTIAAASRLLMPNANIYVVDGASK